MRRTSDAARGKWRGILMQLGISDDYLKGPRVHGPCPLCGGQDRYRWDNRDGSGSYICGQCGAGSGMDLLMKVTGWDFRQAAGEVDRILGNVSHDPPRKPAQSEDQRRRNLNDLWLSSRPIEAADPAGRYLALRVPGCDVSPDLRFAPSAPMPGGGTSPALLAMVRDSQTGEPSTIHRTFLTADGQKLSDRPRALMPGALPDSVSVQLAPAGEVLGIAEGIETALAAQVRFGVPCWAAINATMLAKWVPPVCVRRVIVMGDCDEKFGGQAAAYALAHRLSRQMAVEVRIPDRMGLDWADEAA